MAQSSFQPLAILALNLEEDPNDHSRVPGSLPLSGRTCTFLCFFFFQLRDHCFLHLKKDLTRATWCIGSSASASQTLSLQACAMPSFLWLVLLRCFCLAEASSSILCSGNPLRLGYYSSKGEAQSWFHHFTCQLQHLPGEIFRNADFN